MQNIATQTITKKDLDLLEAPTPFMLNGAMSLVASQLHEPALIKPYVAYFLAYVITKKPFKENDPEITAFVNGNEAVLLKYAEKLGADAAIEMSKRHEIIENPTEDILQEVTKTYERFKNNKVDMFNRVRLSIACYLTGMIIDQGAIIELDSGLVSNTSNMLNLNKYLIENHDFLNLMAKQLIQHATKN